MHVLKKEVPSKIHISPRGLYAYIQIAIIDHDLKCELFAYNLGFNYKYLNSDY
jgi:hypothetical protein